jgi:hypothetical protein
MNKVGVYQLLINTTAKVVVFLLKGTSALSWRTKKQGKENGKMR